MTKSSTYIAPEAIQSAPTSVLSEIPASEPIAQPSAPPLTPDQKQTLAFAKMVVAYGSLFDACKKMIHRARPANKLKHNYFVCAADLEGVAAEMDGEIAKAWADHAKSETSTEEIKS